MGLTNGKLKRERKFHNAWASTIDVDRIDVDQFFEGSTAPENRFIMSNVGDLKNRKMLDIGCGAGESSVYFALKGADCIAGDWSEKMVETAIKLAESYGVSLKGRVIDAMNLEFEDNTFDVVYAANLLHHVDYTRSLKEIHRVLKPGGMACVWDPLRHNPIINIYRSIATEVRSEDESPLDIKIIDYVQSLFSNVKYDTFWLATLWIFIHFFIVERVNPNKERYWKKIIFEESRLREMYLNLEKLDYLIKKIPFFKKYAWNVAIVATK